MSRDIFLRLVFSIIIIILMFALHRLITISPRPQRPALTSEHPLLFAHRGGAALAPENTLAALHQGAALGADALELDVRLTADGELVVFHDQTLERTTNGAGAVRDKTLAELRRLDAGFHFTPDGGATYPFRNQNVTIPTLEEVFREFPEHVVNIDIKDPELAAVERLVQIIETAGATDRAIVGSFHPENLQHFRRLAPNVATAAAPSEVRMFYLLHRLFLWRFHRPLSDVYQIPIEADGLRLATPGFIAHAHRLNQKVHFWTVDDPAVMRRLIEMGADGIMTDRPDLAVQVFREYGYR